MNIASTLIDVARRAPRLPAVTEGEATVSYGELAARVRRIGGSLRACGAAPGERVVLCMENCGAFFETLYGVWAAALVAVPTNAKLHPREVAHIVENSGARLCVTTPGLAEGLVAALPDTEVVVAGDAGYARLLAGEEAPIAHRRPEDLAWIFYTSGTTGQPKGAMLSHRALMYMMHCYYADIDHLDWRDTKLHAAPLSHASGLYALPHLARGGHQVILPGGFDPATIFSALDEHENVTLFGAPTMVSRLTRAAQTANVRTSALRTLYYGGGPMYVDDLTRALATFGPCLFHLYGQGESPMTITGLSKEQHRDTGHPDREAVLASTGYPRTGVEVRVVDAEGRDLPPGGTGEVLTRSDCVMDGYWRSPDATAETIRDGWLWTGDLGALDAAGFLTLRDRSKDMIISGGTNIYPREIEEVLLADAGVVEVSVVGRPHPDWGEEVVAFVVAEPGAGVTPELLDRLCLDNIARMKRPKHYRFVESLPKSNYGKVLKTALRETLAAEAATAGGDA